MKQKKCGKCGRKYVRKKCEFCQRAERWDSIESKKRVNIIFPKRVAYDLSRLSIKTVLKESLYIFGPAGCGKTRYAAQMLLDLNKRSFIELEGASFGFIKMERLLLEFKDAFGETGGESRIIDKYVSFDYLVLDDLGTEKLTDWVFKMLYILIDRRYEEMKPLIITCNLPISKLEKALGDTRMTSRLKQMCLQYDLTGNDYRKQA